VFAESLLGASLIAALDHHHLIQAREWIVWLYRAWGKLEEAAVWMRERPAGVERQQHRRDRREKPYTARSKYRQRS